MTQSPAGAACAQDDPSGNARRLFEQGVDAGASKNWEGAVRFFEESLRLAEHPAARFNLVLANAELRRSLEVVRHAWAFLDLPETESRPEVRVQVRELLEKATRAVAVLNTERVAHEAKLLVDGRAPQVTHGTLVYVPPGSHVLEAQRPGQTVSHKVTLALVAGYFGHWPELPENPTPVAEPQSAVTATPVLATTSVGRSSDRRRYRAAWAVGGVGALTSVAAVAVYATTKLLAEEIEREGTSAPSYVDDANRYRRLKYSIAPLALSGGGLMAGALLIGPRVGRSEALGWGVAALASGVAVVGLGGVWLAQEPRALVEGTPVNSAVAQAGCLWIAGSLPLITYGLIVLIARARHRTLAARDALPLRVSW